jgi:hypothetical protein
MSNFNRLPMSVLEAVGIDPGTVTAMTLDAAAADPPQLTVTYLATDADVAPLTVTYVPAAEPGAAQRAAAQRAVCELLAEAVAGYLLDFDGDEDCGDPDCGDCTPWRPLRDALDVYHAHREVWP